MQGNNKASGLLFKTNKELIDSRTSMNLYNGNFQKMNDSFTISFDISIWDIKTFGYIFRLVNQKQEEISLVFVNFRGEDNLYFDFNSSITNNYIHIPVPKKKLSKGNWLPIDLHFDLKNDQVTILFQGKTYICSNLGLQNPDSFLFVFGLHGINLDVASMALKNINITKHNKNTESFPLDESNGNIVHNSDGIGKGYVKNPVWLIYKHYEWEKVAEFTSACIAGIAYNRISDEIFIVNPDSITTYNAQSRQLSQIKIPEIPFKIISGEAIYNPEKNHCILYTFDDSIAKDLRWSLADIDLNTSPPQIATHHATLSNRLHHHNVFLSNNGQGPYIFGGYGKFTYSNAIYKYNETLDQWDSIPFMGDTIYPRFFAASGNGFNPDEILIFGGFGNQSGKQELGGKNIYDLHIINLNTRTIKKLWEQKATDEPFVPCSNLILDKDKTHFYTICYPHHIAKTELKLYKFNIKDGSYKIVSNSIPFLSEKIESGTYLFFDELLQEFFVVIREYINPEKANIRIYSLYSPPIYLPDSKNNKPNQASSTFITILISTLIVAIIGLSGFIYNKRKKTAKLPDLSHSKQKDNEKKEFDSDLEVGAGAANVNLVEKTRFYEESQTQGEPQLTIRKNAIYVGGDFTAFDKNGKDITYRFSTKIKSLFALILLSKTKDQEGITTKKLTTILWPEKEPIAAKNIRGVTINHFRNILNDLDGIQLFFNDSRWFFSIEDHFYCDFLHIQKLIDEIPLSTNPEAKIKELAGLIKRGPLFWNIQTEWIDDFKQKYESSIEHLLSKYFYLFYEQENLQAVIILSDALFVIDPLNEDILLLAIKSLKKSGKIEQSQNLYNRFSSRYKSLMGENYPVSYTSI